MLPEGFEARMRALLGSEYEDFLASFDRPLCTGLRRNPLKTGFTGDLSRFSLSPVPWCPTGFYYDAVSRPGLSPYHAAGLYYLQEPSAMAPAELLDPQPGERVLDLCAAPGGKSTQLAGKLQGKGLLVCNEINAKRAKILSGNIERLGISNALVLNEHPKRLEERFAGYFDKILVDAPCSGEGMFRKDDAARGEWSEANVRLCASRQDAILREAWRALRPGGTLLYSTCTFNRTEDEGSLERFLAWAGDEVAEAGEFPLAEEWGILGGRVGAFRTFRFFPHRAEGEGFFAAVARKAPDTGGRSRTPRQRREVLVAADKAAAAELARWVEEPAAMRFAAAGDTLYGWYAAQYDAVRSLSGVLPVIYSGVAMGQLFKGRLKPDPALALFAGLRRDAVPTAELGSEDALRFLRKQELAAGLFAEGINLVTASGRALGFVKRIGPRVNNLYPNSLRILRQQGDGEPAGEGEA